jgi:hypothetical protein
MKQAEGAHAVQATQRHVLEEAAQKLVSGQGHALARAVAAVSVVEGDGAVVASGDGLVGESRAMDVASEVVEYHARTRDGLGEDDPALVPVDDRQPQAGHGAASEMEEATSKELGQGPLGHEKRLLARRRNEPGQPIGGERAGGHEQVDVGVPLERARPDVEHGKRADVPAEPAGSVHRAASASKAARDSAPRNACWCSRTGRRSSAGRVKTTWKYGTGKSRSCWRSSQRRVAPWPQRGQAR